MSTVSRLIHLNPRSISPSDGCLFRDLARPPWMMSWLCVHMFRYRFLFPASSIKTWTGIIHLRHVVSYRHGPAHAHDETALIVTLWLCGTCIPTARLSALMSNKGTSDFQSNFLRLFPCDEKSAGFVSKTDEVLSYDSWIFLPLFTHGKRGARCWIAQAKLVFPYICFLTFLP